MFKKTAVIFIMVMLTGSSAFSQTGKEIMQKSKDHMYSGSSYSEFTMQIIKPDWERTMKMKSWAIEPDYALIYVMEPARDRGTVTLKRGNEVWQWVPSVGKVIKIPPSMMSQDWMGSDFSNDDLVRQSSMVEDYEHTVMGEEEIDGHKCWKIKMIPKPEAGIVWGKLFMWVSQEHYNQLKTEFYDEEDVLMRTFEGKDVKKMDGRYIPSVWTMTPEDEPGNKTILTYIEMDFNYNVKESFFSIQNMKRVK